MEASIIFSIVFITFVLLVYVFIILYQNIVIQSNASHAANWGAGYYINQYGEEFTYHTETNPYWRIVDTGLEDKKAAIEAYTITNMSPPLIKSVREVTISTSRILLLKQINVKISEKYPLPAGKLFDVFGFGAEMKFSSEQACPASDYAEFVRNLDMVIDIKKYLLASDNEWFGNSSSVGQAIDTILKKH